MFLKIFHDFTFWEPPFFFKFSKNKIWRTNKKGTCLFFSNIRPAGPVFLRESIQNHPQNLTFGACGTNFRRTTTHACGFLVLPREFPKNSYTHLWIFWIPPGIFWELLHTLCSSPKSVVLQFTFYLFYFSFQFSFLAAE